MGRTRSGGRARSGVAAFGAAAGVLLGGILTDLLSWEWIFFINVPVGLAALALTPVLLLESLDKHGQGFDALGAILVTSGLSILVLGITQGREWGWGSVATIGVFALAAALLALFVAWEWRVRDPLMSFSIFRLRTLTAANVTEFILGTALFSMFLMLTLYLQQVLGYSALETGFAYLPETGLAVVFAPFAAQLVNRVGVKAALIFGMSLLTAGLLAFTQISVDGSYWVDLLPGLIVIGVGLPFCFVPISIAAFAGTREDEAGLASGLLNTSLQIGGAVGIAVLSTTATSTTSDAVDDGTPLPIALTDGFRVALWTGAAIAVIGLLVSIFLVRARDLRPLEEAAREPALDRGAT